MVMGQIVRFVKLPLYLDSVGTVLAGVLGGPWAGAVAGGLTNVIAGLTIDPVSLPFAVVAIVIGMAAGAWTRLGWMKKFYLPPFAGIVTGVLAAFLSAPLSAFIYGGATGTGMDVVVGAFRAAGNSVVVSSLYQGLTTDPIDKLVTFVIVYLIVVALPPRLRARFSQSPTTVSQLPQ
jgi:energy-coupling factor transport system substrate-specific component